MFENSTKLIFITWTTYSPHSFLLSKAFKSKIFYINNLINSRGILWKLFFFIDYLYKSIKTIVIIIKNNPTVVIMQNPPSITPMVVVLFSYLKKYKTIVDSHNSAFEKPWCSLPLYKWSLRNADIVIIHNNQLLQRLRKDKNYNRINFKVLNSKLSEFNLINKEDSLNRPYIFVVSTFSVDEPMEILLEGLRLYNQNNFKNILFKITGNFMKKPFLYNKFKDDINIEFLGFISSEEYKYLMFNAFGTISLSTRDDVQQFALMETIGAEVPFISNYNQTNRYLFGDRMVLVENCPESISKGIEIFIKDKQIFDKNILELKNTIQKKWENDFHIIKSELGI